MNDPRRDDLITEVFQLKRQLQEAHVLLAAKTHECFHVEQCLDVAKQAIQKIAIKAPHKVIEPEAADMAVEFHCIASEALAAIDAKRPKGEGV